MTNPKEALEWYERKRVEARAMADRDCSHCKHNKADGCSRWNCEYDQQTGWRGMSKYRLYRVMYDLDGKHCGNEYIGEVITCKDCKHRREDECPMYFEEQIDIDEGDGYYDTDYIIHDYTQDNGYCHYGERREP